MSGQEREPGREEVRIGVYVCHCGLNIAGVVDVKAVAEYAKTLPGVVVARDYPYMCSDPGQKMIQDDIKKYRLNRVVVASCSPAMHEPTFRRCVEEAGLNRYLMEMVNIREHCSWCHPHEPEEATEKAKDLVRMAVARARLLEPLEVRRASVEPSVLIIGGGIAGITAALEVAKRGFTAYLVEKEPFLGGLVARLNDLMVTWQDGRELLASFLEELDKAVREGKVHLYLPAEVVSVEGYIGNFTARIKRYPRYVDPAKCDACGKCADVCPVEVPDEHAAGLRNRKAIYMPYEGAYPRAYAVDEDACTKCGKCVEACPKGAIDLSAEPEELEVPVGTIIVATGSEPYTPAEGEFGFKEHPDVITSLQLEQLLRPDGPTKGELVRPSDGRRPKRVAFVFCVGVRTPERPYCARICCGVAIKQALRIRERWPDVEVALIYRDIRAFGRGYEEMYSALREAGVALFKYRPEDPPKVAREDKGLVLTFTDPTLGAQVRVPADLVVLVTGLVPRADAHEVAGLLRLTIGPDGFFKEAHPKLRPLDSLVDGVFMAGCCQGPKDIPESITQARGAAARACAPLARGFVEVEPITAEVDPDKCSGCGTCILICPFGAISKDERGIAVVNEVMCKGCGTCAAACPERAIRLKHFTDEQIRAQALAAILSGGGA